MAKKRKQKRKGRIKIQSSARIVEKNDKTYVAKYDTIPRMQAQMPRTGGAVFRVKIRRK